MAMTTKEFFAKHYGSLSAGVFGLGLLTVLGAYGGGFNAFTAPKAQQSAQAQPAPPVPASEQVPPAQEKAEGVKDETAEPEKDPLEEAMAAEAAKAEERRELVREEINKEREAAGLPLLPAVAEEESSGE
jgi:hypothetical protein